MGRRSVKATKSGKFMNPTDQARKEARKKELKKNKKQRLLVRTAVLKNKDPGIIIKELDKLDEIEYNPTEAPPLAEKVLKDKRKKLKETLDRVMKLYQKDNPSYWSELKRIESDYERRRFHRIQFFEAVKQAEGVSNVEEIPLPDIPMPGDGTELANIPLPDSAPPTSSSLGRIPFPPPSMDVQSILKKSPMISMAPGTPTFQGRDPPGVPCGPPPDLSDMEDLSSDEDDEMETEPEKPKLVDNKTKGVRFSDSTKDKEDSAMSEMDRFMKEVEEEFNSMNENEDDLQPPGTESSAASGGGRGGDNKNDPEPEESDDDDVEDDDNDDEDSEMQIRTTTDQSSSSILLRTDPTISIPAISSSSSSSLGSAYSRPPPPQQPPQQQHQPHFFPPPPPGPNMPPNRMRFPPPMPPMMRPNFAPGPSRHYMPPPPGGSRFRQQQPPQHQPPQQQQRSNVFSGSPQISKSDKIVSDSMIQAKPQIRSLSADVTRFIPTAVKTKKDESDRPNRRPAYQIGQSHMHFNKQPQPPRPPQQSKDDAYADFMKEMQDLV